MTLPIRAVRHSLRATVPLPEWHAQASPGAAARAFLWVGRTPRHHALFRIPSRGGGAAHPESAHDYTLIARMATEAARAEPLAKEVEGLKGKMDWLTDILRRRVAERNEAAQRANMAEATLAGAEARRSQAIMAVYKDGEERAAAVTAKLDPVRTFLEELAKSPFIAGAAEFLGHVHSALELLRTFTPVRISPDEALPLEPIPLVTAETDAESPSPIGSATPTTGMAAASVPPTGAPAPGVTPSRWRRRAAVTEADIDGLFDKFHQQFPKVPDGVLRHYIEHYATLPSMRNFGDVRLHIVRAIGSRQDLIGKVRALVDKCRFIHSERKLAVVCLVEGKLDQHVVAGGTLASCWSSHGATSILWGWIREANAQTRGTTEKPVIQETGKGVSTNGQE